MQKERKEEMKLFLLPALFGCWVANPNKVKAGRESSQSSHWCTGQAEGNSTAGREILCFSGPQEALLGWYNTAMPCPSPHLGKSFHLPALPGLFLGFLCLKLRADRVSSSWKSTENVSEHSNLSSLLTAAAPLFICVCPRFFQKCRRIEPALETVNCSPRYH